MTIYDLFLPSLIFLCCYAIWQHNNISIIAKTIVKRHCDNEGVQLLDQNIILERIRLAPSAHSLIACRRHYRFEFSSVGDYRYPGSITLLGKHIETIELAPFKINV